MNWCLGDVLAIHGTEIGPKRHSNWSDAETAVVYPDNNPAGTIMIPEMVAPPARNGAELIPVPAGQPINGSVPSTSPSDAPPAYPGNVPPAMPPRYMSPVRPIIPPPGITPPPSPPSPPPSPLDPFPAESQPAPLSPPKETNSGVQLRLRSTPSAIGPNQGEVRAATYQGAARPVEARGYAPPGERPVAALPQPIAPQHAAASKPARMPPQPVVPPRTAAPPQAAVSAVYVAPVAAPGHYVPPGFVPLDGPPAYPPPRRGAADARVTSLYATEYVNTTRCSPLPHVSRRRRREACGRGAGGEGCWPLVFTPGIKDDLAYRKTDCQSVLQHCQAVAALSCQGNRRIRKHVP